MRIAAYVHMHRSRLGRGPTGVGKHINEMVPRLAAMPGVELSILSAAQDLENGKAPSDSPLGGLPLRQIPWPRKFTELSWLFLNRPKVERWSGDVDWVYCPAEAYVAARRAKRAVAIHGIDWFEPDVPWYNDANTVRERRVWKSRFHRFRSDVELVLPVSQFLAGRLAALLGIPQRKMRVVNNGVEEAYFSPGVLGSQWAKLIDNRPYVLAVGGLTVHKGAEYLFGVAQELAKRHSDVHILIAGRNDPKFDPMVPTHKHITMCGYVDVANGLPELLNASVALLYPSRYDTFGIPIVEAMAAGTPAIVSHFAALPEVAGDAGIIVDPSKPGDIADVIEQLARDSTLRQKHVEAGRRRAQLFRWENCAQRLYEAMKEFSR